MATQPQLGYQRAADVALAHRVEESCLLGEPVSSYRGKEGRRAETEES
jgi:hypothetical protein